MNSDDEKLPPALARFAAIAEPFILWVGRIFLGWNRLERVPMIALDTPIEDVIAIFGEPIESKPAEDYPGTVTHTFAAGHFHGVVINEVDRKARLITYRSSHAAPVDDLRFMMAAYGEGVGWRELERGYWYWRKDDNVRLWCSVAPAIGVATSDYFEAKSLQRKITRQSEPIVFADMVEWTSNDTISEMQRRFMVGDTAPLREFGARSSRVAFSSNGQHVFVVRDHRAHAYKDGFMETNVPPEEGGQSTEVINYFHLLNEGGGSTWGKVRLPRDARVSLIRFNEDQYEMKISHGSTDKVLSFSGTPQSLYQVNSLTENRDAAIWASLEKLAI